MVSVRKETFSFAQSVVLSLYAIANVQDVSNYSLAETNQEELVYVKLHTRYNDLTIATNKGVTTVTQMYPTVEMIHPVIDASGDSTIIFAFTFSKVLRTWLSGESHLLEPKTI